MRRGWAWQRNGTDFLHRSARRHVLLLIFCSSLFLRLIASRSTQHTLQAVTQDTTFPPRGSRTLPFSFHFRLSFMWPPPRSPTLDTAFMYIRRPSYSSRKASRHLSIGSFNTSTSALSFHLSLACLYSSRRSSGGTAVHTISAEKLFSLLFSPPFLSSLI